MKVIGITGGVGAGKSRIVEILEKEYGAEVIKADTLAKQLMEPGEEGYERLKAVYGAGILDRDGFIDRPGLAERMYHDDDVIDTVNRLIHPLVWTRIRQLIHSSPGELTAVELALPDENHRDIFSELWYVYTSEENRINRLLAGRGYQRERTRSMMNHQLTEAQFRAMADVVIDNNGSIEDVRRCIALRLTKKG